MDPTLPNNSRRPAAAIGATAGDWRLDRLPKSRTVFLALALSLGVHTAFLLAFNRHAPRTVWVPLPVGRPIDDGPWVPEPEEPPPTDTDYRPLDEPPPVNVPRLPDAPSRIDLGADFVVPLLPPATRPEINTGEIARIPIGTGPRSVPKEGIFEIKDVGRAPRAVAQPAPRFPPELQHEVASAELVVEFIVDTSGSVRGATIISSTHHGFDRPTLDGVRLWKFQPGLKDGRKVNTRIRQPIRFTLEATPGT